jgi:hypothetical protein
MTKNKTKNHPAGDSKQNGDDEELETESQPGTKSEELVFVVRDDGDQTEE